MMPALHSVLVLRVSHLVVAFALAGLGLGACAKGSTLGDGGSGGTSSDVTTGPSTSSKTSATSGVTSGPSTSTGGPTSSVTSGPGTTGPTTAVTTGSGMSPPGTLFFSEYVEGSGNNKALEIFNAGPTPVDLSACEIDRYTNGSVTAASPIALTATMLASGKTFVICHTSFVDPTKCDQLSGSVQHTGNDVMEISCNGTLLDAFGTVGDMNVWGTAPTSAMDATLRRKCSVTVGDTNPNDAFDPATQWDGFPIDTFTDLGVYNCP